MQWVEEIYQITLDELDGNEDAVCSGSSIVHQACGREDVEAGTCNDQHVSLFQSPHSPVDQLGVMILSSYCLDRKTITH